MLDKFLPIGTIVLLEGATKKLMITGFCMAPSEAPDEVYDYSGCLFPEGTIAGSEVALFNHDQIDSIFHVGYIDEEELEFKKNLEDALNEESSNSNSTEELSNDTIDVVDDNSSAEASKTALFSSFDTTDERL